MECKKSEKKNDPADHIIIIIIIIYANTGQNTINMIYKYDNL